MSLAPFFAAPFIIQLHILFAMAALLLGPFALFRTRRDIWHKWTGYIWIVLIIAVSVTGLFIPSHIAIIWHFGPIHLFSIFALSGVAEGFYHIRKGRVAKHRASMQSVWFGAMGLAGLFTLLPGRTMNRIVFGDATALGWLAIAVGLAALAVLWRWQIARTLA